MNKQFLRFLQATLFSLDIVILNLVFLICNVLFNEHASSQYSKFLFEYWVLINSFWVIFAWLGGVYAEKSILSFELFSARTMKAYIIWFIFLILYLFFIKGKVDLPLKKFVASTILLSGFGLFVCRFAYIGIKIYLKNANQLVKRILIIGYNKTSKKLALYLEQEGINTEILGFTENAQNVKEVSHYPIISDIDASVEVSKQLQVDEIFSTITPEQDPRLYLLIRQAEDECIRFRIVPVASIVIVCSGKLIVKIDLLDCLNILSRNSSETCTGNTPLLSALFLKISAKKLETTASNPASNIAHAACSLEDPQPKFLPATKMLPE